MKISTLGVICLQRAAGLPVRYVKRPGRRPGNVLNILFCLVPFWPIETKANFGHGYRKVHFQSMKLTESCYSRKEAIRIRSPTLEKRGPLEGFLHFVFLLLLSKRDWQDYAHGGRREGRAGGEGEGTVLDHQADGGSVGGQRCNGCKRTKNQNQEDSGPPLTRCFYFLAIIVMERRAHIYMLCLFPSPTRPVPVSGDISGCHTWREGGDATASRG